MKPTLGAWGALALLVCTCSQTSGDGGGARGSGGAPAPDGGTESGGVTGTGGVPSSGGAAGTGSTAGTGGVPGSGGSRPATGGAAMPPASGGAAGGVSGGHSGGIGGAAGKGSGGAGGPAGSAGSRGSGGSPGSAGAPGSGGAPPAPLAFPQAQGFGKMVTGGRDGVVYHVTNLNDAGAGSFRDAVSHSNRFVIFDVGGYVQLATAVSLSSNLTIAGQTAPGGGIGFRGGELSLANSSNVILRFVRVRPGGETASTDDDALSLYRARDVIIDHSSFELAPWNDIDGVSDDWQNHPVTNITFQDCLIADPTGQQFGAHTESVSSRWSWYRNIFANSHNRNPLAKVDNVFVNNVLYNVSAGYTTHTSTAFQHDIVNNYFIFGPASTGADDTWFQIDKNQSIYAAGNLKDTDLDGALNGTATTPSWYQGTGTVLTSAWSPETNVAPPLTAASAARLTMSQSGALPRDALDALIISQVMTLGKGTAGTAAGTTGPGSDLYTSQAQTGLAGNGYGTIEGGVAAPDADGDGMPDFWEVATGSAPAAGDATTKAADGYTLLEHYVDWLAEPHATTAAGSALSIDLAAFTGGFAKVSPAYTVTAGPNGAVTLASDGHTAQFVPATSFHGLASFSYGVKGSDGSAGGGAIVVVVSP
jgi:pectate lyase